MEPQAPATSPEQPPKIPAPHLPSSRVEQLLCLIFCTLLFQVVLQLMLMRHAPAPRWEYSVKGIPDLNFESQSNDLGAEGWELVTARRAQGADEKMLYEMVFKRPVEPGRKAR